MPSKKDDASHTEKILGLYALLLLAQRTYSLRELSEHFQCSKATMLRLLNKVEKFEGSRLERESALIDGHTQSLYRLRRTASASERTRMAISGSELHLLHFCRDLAAPFLPAKVRYSLSCTLQRASILVPQGEPLPQVVLPVVQPALLGSIDYSPHEATLRTLLQAIERRMVCLVTYQSPERPQRQHEMAVTRLVSGKHALYAHGWRVEDKGTPAPRHPLFLAVHRIKDIALTRRTHALTTPEQGAGFGIMDGTPFTVEVCMSSTVAAYVRERTFGPDQVIRPCEDGGLLLTFTARSEDEVLAWVLSYGRHARVLAPEQLVGRVRQEAATIALRY